MTDRRIVALMKNGQEKLLDPALGNTTDDVIRNATGHALTGSAVEADEIWLRTADGSQIRYSNVEELGYQDGPE